MQSGFTPLGRDISSFDAAIDSDVDSDAFSTSSLAPFSASDHTSQTSVSIRSASPTPSVWSVTSSLRRQAFRNEYGRGLNNYSEVYRLPADDEELDRLGTSILSCSRSSHLIRRG
jgi:hypothetical protein